MDASCIKSCPPVLDYKTEKYVLTKNRKIGALHRLLHLGILCYIIGWVLILKKGYQETDSDPHFSLITKLKGVSVTKDFRQVEDKLWDVADFVKPAQGENVLFLVTSFIATPGQVQSVCPESPLILDARCGENLDCPAGESVLSGNGIKTGKCVKLNKTHSTCEIYGWCPVENASRLSKPRLSEAENFTLFIKNAVHFRKFNFSSSNTLETLNETYFKSCMYDPVSSPYCPVFRIQDIIRQAGYSFADLSVLGGVVNAHIEWRCDLDHPLTLCKPHYDFQLQAKENNFRTATYYWNQDGREYRDLLKLYGIRFDISVTGEARKFGVIPTAVSLGTGCAFLGGATFLCDLILLYLDEKASFYRSCKYEEVNPPDEQQSTSPGKLIDNFNQEA
ncbi:P2X purinoceptor 6 [Spea bombifrons]|uniref:P2X purinoceptor 6 n=1 Tax=Spea bombifrons TaxID=233779 RepID=UPI00234BE2FF|nr:P2X purinoceptor 6 [Spea bombifrons]